MGVAPALRFVSLLAANGRPFYQAVVDYLSTATGLPASLSVTAPDSLADLLSAGLGEAAFTCGLPYVRLTAAQPDAVRLLAAPVLPGQRYAGRPIYYSDFVVRAEAPWQTLSDLRGADFAYNQAESLSGYVLPLHHLHTLGETSAFFSHWRATGSHAASLACLERGKVDVAAIDSVVLAMESQQRPDRLRGLRVIGSAGPLAMPPVVATAQVPADTAQRLTHALCAMHTTAAGQAALAVGGVARFAEVTDADYDDIRAVLRALEAQPSVA